MSIDTLDTRLGDFTVLGPFNWSQSTGTADFGTAVTSGTWDDLKEVPANDSNTATYTGGSGSKEGGVTAHDGSRPGPKGSESILDGTIKAVKWGWRAKKSVARYTQRFKGKYGKSVSVGVDHTAKTADRILTTSFQNWWTILDADAANAPTTAHWFQIGMEKTENNSLAHLRMGEMWTFILHQEPVVAVTEQPAIAFGANF